VAALGEIQMTDIAGIEIGRQQNTLREEVISRLFGIFVVISVESEWLEVRRLMFHRLREAFGWTSKKEPWQSYPEWTGLLCLVSKPKSRSVTLFSILDMSLVFFHPSRFQES